MKVGLVYTSTTKELTELVEQEVRKNIGEDAELLSYEDPSILAEVREAGYVTGPAAARLVAMFMKAVTDGAEAILNICSSVGEAADAAREIGRYTGVPIVRIDEEMCRDAVRQGRKIGVMATLSTTLEPTKNTIRRVAREMGREAELIDGLVEGAFGLDQEEFKELMLQKANELKDKVDVILLCQGSMAYCEEFIHSALKKPVCASPRYGASALKEALIAKGALPC